MNTRTCNKCGKDITKEPHFGIEVTYTVPNSVDGSTLLCEGIKPEEIDKCSGWATWEDIHFCKDCIGCLEFTQYVDYLKGFYDKNINLNKAVQEK